MEKCELTAFTQNVGEAARLGFEDDIFRRQLHKLIAETEKRRKAEREQEEEDHFNERAEAEEQPRTPHRKVGPLFPHGNVTSWGMLAPDVSWCVVEQEGEYAFYTSKTGKYERSCFVASAQPRTRITEKGIDAELVFSGLDGNCLYWCHGKLFELEERFVRRRSDGRFETYRHEEMRWSQYRIGRPTGGGSISMIDGKIEGIVHVSDERFPCVIRSEGGLSVATWERSVQQWPDFEKREHEHKRHIGSARPIIEDGKIVDLVLIGESRVWRTRADGPPVEIGRLEGSWSGFAAYWGGEPWWFEGGQFGDKRLCSPSRAMREPIVYSRFGGLFCFEVDSGILIVNTRDDWTTYAAVYDGDRLSHVSVPRGYMETFGWPIVLCTYNGENTIARWDGETFIEVMSAPAGRVTQRMQLRHGDGCVFQIVGKEARTLAISVDQVNWTEPTVDHIELNESAFVAGRALVGKKVDKRRAYTDGVRQYGNGYDSLGPPWVEDGRLRYYAVRRRQPFLIDESL